MKNNLSRSSMMSTKYWVWKGILRNRDLTKFLCGNQENNKYLDGISDLTAPRDSLKFGHGIWDFFGCLLGIQEIVRTQVNALVGQSCSCLLSIQTTECVWLIVI